MSSSRPDAAQDLEYPPIRVDRSLAQLDLNTLIMRSNPHHPPEEATSLADSAFEVLDHPADLSDDDGHTASVASTSPDDMSVTLSETESEDEDEDEDEDEFEDTDVDEADQLADSATADPLDDHVVAAAEDSTLTERPGLGDSESSFHFKMEERSVDSDGFCGTETFTIVKEFTPEQSSSKVLEPYGCSEIRLAVRAGLAERFYPERASFRVLFIGQLDTWSEEGIRTSLLNALLASPGSSKSIIVNGKMEPYSPILYADHCTGVKGQSETGRPKRTIFRLKGSDGTELVMNHNGRQGTADLARWPDLVVFCYPKSGVISLSNSDYVSARIACRALDIPIIDVTDHRRFNEEQPGFKGFKDATRLRVCVEGKSNSGFCEVDELPVDVYTFMHLEPSLLNRHLATISHFPPTCRASKRSRETKTWRFSDFLPTPYRELGSHLTTVLAIVALSTLITTTLFGASYSHLNQSKPSSGIVPAVVSNSLVSAPISAASATASEATVPTTSAPSVKDKIDEFFAKQRQTAHIETEKAVEGLQKMAENFEQLKTAVKLREKLEKKKAEMRRREEAAKIAKIGGFEIVASGDQQFILRPSKGFIGRTRKPQLQIQVSRDSKAIPIRYERTIDGVYIVDLEDEYPIGLFNVSIATHSKPLMQQSFNISLGHTKSRMGNWFSVLRNEGKHLASFIQRESVMVQAAQHQFENLSSSLSQQVQKFSARLTNGGQSWKDKITYSSQEVIGRAQEATKKVDRQLSEVRDQTWTSLRQVTAPVRTSRRTLWARNNAYLLRCSFERAVGLSSTDKDGKKTRSCEAANW